MKKEKFARTFFDLQNEYQWIRMLGWTEDELRAVPVHPEVSSGEERMNLANFGGTALGTNVYSGGETSAKVGSIENMYVFKREVPNKLWKRLSDLMDKGGPSAFEDGQFGAVGDRDNFPPS